MKFQKGDILKRNQKFKEYAQQYPNRGGELSELYEVVVSSENDPHCKVITSNFQFRVGKQTYLKAEWVEIAEYS